MSDQQRERSSVWRLEGGLLLLDYDQWSNGVMLGGNMVCEATHAGVLADMIAGACIESSEEERVCSMAPDNFKVYRRSNDLTMEGNVHVHNVRDAGAPFSEIRTFSGM